MRTKLSSRIHHPLKPILALKSRKIKTQIVGGSSTISSETFFVVSRIVSNPIQFDFVCSNILFALNHV